MEEARAYCKKNFGDLAVITGESERKFLWKQVGNWEYVMMLHAFKNPMANVVIKLQCDVIMSQQIAKGSKGQYYIGMTVDLDKSFR